MAETSINERHLGTFQWAPILDIRHTDDSSALFGDVEIDVAMLSMPPSTHYEPEKQMLEAGKHCVSGKPFSCCR